MTRRRIASAFILALLLLAARLAQAEPRGGLVHGLWVWKSPRVLEARGGAQALLEFCTSQGINEVYVSISAKSAQEEETALAQTIRLLHRSKIRVEALLSSTQADEPGKHRETLLRHVRGIVEFDEKHGEDRFDGIHLDIEPQQRPENRGSGNLRFLPGLAEAFREVVSVAGPAGMTVNADIQNKLLKGDAEQRRMLLGSVPRVTLMLYELSSPGDGQTAEQQAEKAAQASQKFLAMAYGGLGGQTLAKMVIALRTADYGDRLPLILRKLDDTNRGNPNYLGWARHSYSDVAPESLD